MYVLILVVVEDGLVRDSIAFMLMAASVLILVVVEDGLVRAAINVVPSKEKSLNPCCSGRWSRTDRTLMLL